MQYDFCIVGGGNVGLATAYALLRRNPGASLVLIEKENALGSHQTGHNSGVIHAGVYYKPGSLKAMLCRKGARATQEFCQLHNLPYEIRGKIIVATDEKERHLLQALKTNAEMNGLSVEPLCREQLLEHESNVAGIEALLVPDTGIVDYRQVSQALGHEIKAMGADLHLGEEVIDIEEVHAGIRIRTNKQTLNVRYAVTCGGLQADRLARLTNRDIDFRIIPFRGEYYAAPREKSSTFQHLIYPVPDPSLPFLGVHFTPTIGGDLTIGPNAVPGFAREGYRKYSLDPRDLATNLSYGGFWRLAAAHWKFAIEEFRDSIWKPAYLAKCRRYWPALELDDLGPWNHGIRAQAVSRDGTMLHDFHFTRSKRVLHVCNAPSPAATSALPIGEMIAEKFQGMNENDS